MMANSARVSHTATYHRHHHHHQGGRAHTFCSLLMTAGEMDDVINSRGDRHAYWWAATICCWRRIKRFSCCSAQRNPLIGFTFVTRIARASFNQHTWRQHTHHHHHHHYDDGRQHQARARLVSRVVSEVWIDNLVPRFGRLTRGGANAIAVVSLIVFFFYFVFSFVVFVSSRVFDIIIDERYYGHLKNVVAIKMKRYKLTTRANGNTRPRRFGLAPKVSRALVDAGLARFLINRDYCGVRCVNVVF